MSSTKLNIIQFNCILYIIQVHNSQKAELHKQYLAMVQIPRTKKKVVQLSSVTSEHDLGSLKRSFIISSCLVKYVICFSISTCLVK